MSNRALTPGHRLGPFDIEGVLGAGSFGITYRAHDRNLHRSVAIKEFFPRAYAARDPDRVTVNPQSEGHARGYRGGLNLFLNEARVLAKYRHPSIVRVSQLFRANNTAYIVMDYEKGATLSAVLKRTTHFTTRRIVELARELLSGLSKLHEAGVIHCDIAPRNIILRDDGSYVLIDFGAVRTLWDAEVTAGSGNRYTPAYAPPELWFTGAPTGPWSDIFCLGAVLYHCITGEAPLDASRRKRLVDNATRGLDSVHLALAVQKESRPAGLLDTVRWMLALTPERRPQSAGEILAALSNSSGVAPTVNAPHSPRYTTHPRAPRDARTPRRGQPVTAETQAFLRRRLTRSLPVTASDLICRLAVGKMSEEQVLDCLVGLRVGQGERERLFEVAIDCANDDEVFYRKSSELVACLVDVVKLGRTTGRSRNE